LVKFVTGAAAILAGVFAAASDGMFNLTSCASRTVETTKPRKPVFKGIMNFMVVME
jgi:hypothetical protein